MDKDIVVPIIGGVVAIVVALINKDRICNHSNPNTPQDEGVPHTEAPHTEAPHTEAPHTEAPPAPVAQSAHNLICNTMTPHMCRGEIKICIHCHTSYCLHHLCVNNSPFIIGGHVCSAAP